MKGTYNNTQGREIVETLYKLLGKRIKVERGNVCVEHFEKQVITPCAILQVKEGHLVKSDGQLSQEPLLFEDLYDRTLKIGIAVEADLKEHEDIIRPESTVYVGEVRTYNNGVVYLDSGGKMFCGINKYINQQMYQEKLKIEKKSTDDTEEFIEYKLNVALGVTIASLVTKIFKINNRN